MADFQHRSLLVMQRWTDW